ncbi:hypothetical protein COPCOM_00777 [Coprococcus comes ATCC 27758]|uniref:Uncharacterized protein n=1 Tax=Coprococcus comes ATCC 27758 TaxID=470146 RepID=C0B6K6_9FIRM|nr:hypothetical protein COPCOM_00777 [Coprococcus comes ATCC 27758]
MTSRHFFIHIFYTHLTFPKDDCGTRILILNCKIKKIKSIQIDEIFDFKSQILKVNQ